MARQTGIVRIKGTIGGINFYDLKGEDLLRTAGGGFQSNCVKKYPRIREQTDEMSAASTNNKFFKHSFRVLLTGYTDGTLHSRLQSFFMRVKDLDVLSIRGQRTVANGMDTPYGKRLLKEFPFTPKRAMLLHGQLSFDWSSSTLQVRQFNIADAGIPKEADVMGLLLLTVRFDFNTNTYESQISDALILPRSFEESTFDMTTPPLTDGPGIRFAMLRVAYYQEVNGTYYLLSGEGKFGLGVVGVE